MKKFISACISVVLICGLTAPQTVYALTEQDVKLSERQTFLNNVTDFFATIGKSDAEKKKIIRRRRDERKFERLQQIKLEQKRKAYQLLHKH